MVSLWPGGVCEPCKDRRHLSCLGWRGPGICGCSRGACLIRLLTYRARDRERDDKGETDEPE